MRALLGVLLLLALSLAAHARPGGAPAVLRLDNGMPLIVSPAVDISSATNKTGDEVTFTVVHPCKVDGHLLVASGATVSAVVSDAEHSKMFGRPGKLEIIFFNTASVDGSPLRVRAAMQSSEDNDDMSQQGNQEKQGAAKLATFLPYGLGLVFNGKEAVLKAGTPLTIFADEDVDFQVSDSAPPKRITPVPPPAEAPTENSLPEN